MINTGTVAVRTRRPETDAELAAALQQPPARWLELAPKLRAETMAALARSALRANEPRVFGELVLKHLHTRALPIATRNCRGLPAHETQEVMEKIQFLITDELLAATGSQVHYMEVSFGSFVKRKTLNFARDARRRVAPAPTSNPDEGPSEIEPSFDPQEFERERKTFFRRMEVRLALERVLPSFKEEILVAFHYWYHDDMPIESKDSRDMSISRMLGRDKRTIYFWLKKIFDAVESQLGARDETE